MTTKKQVQVGWAVTALDGARMFWHVDEKPIAYGYCEDGAEPVAVWADAEELENHDAAQGES